MDYNAGIKKEIQNIRKILTSLTEKENKLILENLENMNPAIACNLMHSWRRVLLYTLSNDGNRDVATQILRKFNDSGRRSPPWQEGSAKKAGARRPQDGEDGNRKTRWLFEKTHEYYASETMSCLVELKFVLQTFSMVNGPKLPQNSTDLYRNPILVKILGHEIKEGAFRDPLTLETPDFAKFKDDRRYIESGHITPHGRGGRHNIQNATLAYRVSNRMQSDLTIDEALENMAKMLRNHSYTVKPPK